MRKIATLLTTVLALAAPLPALAHKAKHRRTAPRHQRHRGQAAHRVIHHEPGPQEALAIALQRAHELWGVEPCGGHYRVETSVTLPEGVGGEAVWDSPTGRNYGSPPSTWTNCILRLGPEITFSSAGGADDWTMECTIVMHEYGHLTGHSHIDESDPNAPGVPSDTPEQANVMLSGRSFEDTPEADLKRCGWEAGGITQNSR